MDSVYSQLLKSLQAGEPAVTATVIETRGSTPREVGSKMLIRRSGETVGSIGGGCGEAEVWHAALQVLDTGRPQLVLVDLTGEISMDSAAVCGGTMDLLVDPWGLSRDTAGGPSDLSIVSLLVERLERRESSVLATAVAFEEGLPAVVGRVVLGPDGMLLGGLGSPDLDAWLAREALSLLDQGGFALVLPAPPSLSDPRPTHRLSLFLEAVRQPPLLVVVGAGHIAVPLVKLGKLVGFDVAVLDDRAIFANRERFPEADRVLAMPFAEGLHALGIDRHCYLILITRGHQHDVECLRELIHVDPAYIGMIGSRRRVRAVFELLRREGVPPEWLHRVYAPIGLDIGARTPEEIALSIAAEIVQVRRGGKGASLSRGARPSASGA